MTLDEILAELKIYDPNFDYNKARGMQNERDWWKMERDVWQKQAMSLVDQINVLRDLALGVAITPPIKTKPVNTSTDLAPIFFAHPTISKCYFNIWGGEYQATTISEMDRFFQVAKIQTIPYEENYHECGKFAFGLMGAFYNTKGWWDTPVGVILSNSHVQNFAFAFEDEEMTKLTAFIIEPQNNMRMPLSVITETVGALIMG